VFHPKSVFDGLELVMEIHTSSKSSYGYDPTITNKYERHENLPE
jgi:hypothetical protein